MTRHSLVTVIVIVLTASLMACGGGGKKGLADVTYYELPDVTVPDGMDVPPQTDTDEERPQVLGCEIVPLFDADVPISLKAGESDWIRVKVIDHELNGAAPNVALYYQIDQITDLLGAPAQGDGQLGAEVAYTDESGVAKTTFAAGMAVDLIYTVSISADCGDPVTVQIVVSESPMGCIEVFLEYDGGLSEASLNTIKLHVLPGDYTCGLLSTTITDPAASLADKTITDLYGTAKFESIPAGNYYTVFATAKGPKFPGQEEACVVANGCREGVFVQPDKCQQLKPFTLYSAVMNPTGCYESVDKFDLSKVIEDCAGGDTTIVECATATGAVGQQICCVLNEIETFFTNPGETIVETIVDIAKQFLPTIIVDAVANIFKDAVAKIVTDLLFNAAPDFIKDFFTIGQDMVGIITHPELPSELCLSKLNSDYSIEGTHYYTGIILYWKIGCDPSAPDYDTCGQLIFDLDDLQNTQFPVSLVEGQFTASIWKFNQLLVDPHLIKLNYGKLILFVLNEVLIPTITGGQAHSMLEAAKLWINCKALADGVIGEVLGLIPGLDKSDVEDVCNETIDFLLGPVDLFLGSLTLDSNISIQGSGTMVDDPCDLKVNKIVNGVWTGQIQTSESAQSAVTGTWSATKK